MNRSRLDEIQKEIHEKVFANILVKLFESEEANRTFTCYITLNCALLLVLSILFIIFTIIIIIYPNFPRNTVVILFTIPSSEWKPSGPGRFSTLC